MRLIFISLIVLFFVGNLYSQSEQFELIYNPELGKTYSLSISTSKLINLKSVDILVNEGRVLYGDSVKVKVDDLKILNDFSINFKNIKNENDTLTFEASISNLKYSIYNHENNPLVTEDLKKIEKNNEIFSRILNVPFEFMITSKGKFVYSDYIKKLVLNNEDIKNSLSEEDINSLKSELNNKINYSEADTPFIYDLPIQQIALNDEWQTTQIIRIEFGKPYEVTTTYRFKDFNESNYEINSISSIDYSVNNSLNSSTNIETKIVANASTVYEIDRQSGWIIYSKSKSDTKSYMDTLYDLEKNQKYGFRNETTELTEITIEGKINH
ncbi:MAG: DUF6263 family protein [Flavobacteriaceae bacterium]